MILFVLVAMLIVVFVFLSSADRSVLFSKPSRVSINGLERTYRVYKPSQEINKIIVGLHGFGGNGRSFAYYTGLQNVVDDTTLVVYPDASKPTKKGMKTGWNSGFCCGSGYFNNIDDAGFLVALIEQFKQGYGENTKIFVAGFSNGAFMAQRLAVEYPEIIDGVASISGSIGTERKALGPKQPVPILVTHGKLDKTVPFNGGPGNDPDFVWLSYQQTLAKWSENNGSTALTETVVYESNGHKWNGWRLFNFWQKNPNQSQSVVEFFNKL